MKLSGQGTLNDNTLLLKKAEQHPIMYYVSLPQGWTVEKEWPIIIIAEAAEKEYKENILRFAEARKTMPFILVAPFNLNNG